MTYTDKNIREVQG